MISYLLATKNNIVYLQETLNSILSLPAHDKEIIICCPAHLIENDTRYKWVADDKCTGSAYAYNLAYKHSNGEYILGVTDDTLLPDNFLDILDFMQSDFMSKKKFKISNIMWDGGPGLAAYGHHDLEDGKNVWPIDKYHPVNLNDCPYSVIPMPFFERKTVEQYLNNTLWHPMFKNHYIDHWLGFYVCKNESYEPNKWRCPEIYYRVASQQQPVDGRHDAYDSQILQMLTSNFIKGETLYA